MPELRFHWDAMHGTKKEMGSAQGGEKARAPAPGRPDRGRYSRPQPTLTITRHERGGGAYCGNLRQGKAYGYSRRPNRRLGITPLHSGHAGARSVAAFLRRPRVPGHPALSARCPACRRPRSGCSLRNSAEAPSRLVIGRSPTRCGPKGGVNVQSDLTAVDPARGLPVRRGCGSDRARSEPASESARRGQIGEIRRGTDPPRMKWPDSKYGICNRGGRQWRRSTSRAPVVQCLP